MSFCLACAEWTSRRPLCNPCNSDLGPGPRWRLPSGLLVASGLAHRGAARRLVHRLKYEGLEAAADVLASFMAALLPAGADALVPVTRARVRRVRFGIDPAVALAVALSRRTGVRVDRALAAPLWWPRHAMRVRDGRTPPRFRAVARASGSPVLVDDVATSGTTLAAADEALRSVFRHGIVATAPGRVKLPAPADAGEVAWRSDRT